MLEYAKIKQSIKIEYSNYGIITIPKGTKVIRYCNKTYKSPWTLSNIQDIYPNTILPKDFIEYTIDHPIYIKNEFVDK